MSDDKWRGLWIAVVDDRVQHGFSYRDGRGIASKMEMHERTTTLAERMSAQLRVKGDGLADVAHRAGRKLPKRLKRDTQILIEAEELSGHPKLAKQIDLKNVIRAERRLNAFLDKQNPAAERRGEILDAIARIAFVIVTVVLAVFFTLIYQGYFD